MLKSSAEICHNCGKQALSVFYEARDVPVQSSLMVENKQKAVKIPRGDIVLGFCEECGFISNIAFDPSKLDYSSAYEDQQCFSSRFNAFAQILARHLVDKHDLYNKRILEIGCGKGDFLALLCELGHNYGVGIDPAYVPGRIHSEALHRLTFIRDFFSERYARYNGDMVCCRHTLEHIQNTNKFAHSVRRAIGNHLDTFVFFEVPDVTRVLQELAFWDVYYEHCSYFSPGSLARLFRFCKFEVIDLRKDFDDQYILIEAKPVSQASGKARELEESVKDMARYVEYFAANCHDKLDQWKTRLQQIHENGKKVVIWGSGSKCVSFMTTLKVKDEVQYVVDVNPYRHGMFLPGIGQKIMPPEFLEKFRPDVTLVMNPIYCEEIQHMLDGMGVNTEVIPV